MLPSLIAREISEGLKQYVITGFETPTPFFRGAFTALAEQPGGLFKGPYLSLGYPFQPSGTGRDFFAGFETEHPPFVHQEQAWRRLSADREARSALIATGTGSGKTECFLYPLLDYCLREHEAGRPQGIKAIVIYPMNALANDQARRFAAAIHANANLRGRLRVGLFVGTGDKSPCKSMTADNIINCRDTLREAPPDILLTNYKMLDYMLIRPRDRALWRFNQPATLRYLVVDELHTFDGAQGTDLACLLRRLRARLQTPVEHIIAVGTSATLGAESEKGPLAHYASQIFQTPFDEQSIIGESRQSREQFLGSEAIEYMFDPPDDLAERLDPGRYSDPSSYLIAQYALFFPDQQNPEQQEPGPKSEPDNPDWRVALGRQLKQHILFNNLLRRLDPQPRALPELAQELAAVMPRRVRHLADQVLDSLCALISCARGPAKPQLPLLSLRIQLWVRELRRMVSSTVAEQNGPPALLFADDLRQDRSAVHLPLVQCNACHMTAWAGFKPSAQTCINSDLRAIYSAFFSRNPDFVLLLPLLPDEPAPAVKGIIRWLCGGCGYLQGEGEQCQGCGEEKLQRVFYPDNRRQRSVQGASRLVHEHICPVCETRDSLLVFGARVASLGSVALSHLYASAYNDDPKLIAFSDSVQDAAHRAGFFSARTWLSNMRMAITQALAKHPDDTIPLPVFYDYLPRFWQDKSLNPAALGRERFIAEFLAPNMQWLPDFQTLCKTGALPADSHLLDDIHKRLQWEVLAEFGYRSRIGRTLVRTATAAAGIELAPVQLAALRLLTTLREEFGLRDLSNRELTWFLLGLVLRLQHKGAIYHPFLDAYIAAGGRTYILNRQAYLPAFAPSTPAPVMLTDAPRQGGFDTLHGRWYQDWCKRTLGRQQLLPQNSESSLYRLALDALAEAGIVKVIRVGKNTVWCLQPDKLYLSADTATLTTDGQRSTLCVTARMAAELVGLPALEHSDPGAYQLQPKTRHWLSRLYRQGRIQRVMAAEHTGLLDSEDRQLIEQDFIRADKPWSPNLLSATPTLEMGINIGALSSVLLCSVPPTQANYLQRIGRAGRRDGNAFSLTLAAGRAHDLYFYAQPEQMMAGRIDAPGVFLNASAVIERQLVAYCMDRWVASGIDDSAMPRTLRPVLDHVQKGNLKSFPYNFIAFCQREALPILEAFLGLFGNDLHERTRQYLRHVLLGGDDSIESLELQLVKRLTELVKERERLSSRIDALKRHVDKLERQPQDEVLQQEINEARQERSGLQAIKRRINGKETLNFFTDEGLIPNYAFPEAGVLLRSVIYWRRTRTDDSKGKYESRVYEYERPGVSAVSEFAPANHFYADGHKVRITQVDMELSDIETWRFCPRCSHAENLAEHKDTHSACPRCGDPLWANVDQRMRMARLRQVMANTHDRDSRIGDDSEDREPVFYTRQMLADFEPQAIEAAYRIASDSLPFGFEYIRKVAFREINFGEHGNSDQTSLIAGHEISRPGFRLCRSCGMVQESRNAEQQQHAFSCRLRQQNEPDNIIDCLYLYREFSSEAVRILLPTAAIEGAERNLNSLVAALQLGLRKQFGGQVDHLRMTRYDEPIADSDNRRRYLLLYDSVPGGTGYLRELLRDHRALLGVLQKALAKLTTCPCNFTTDPAKDGCYQCLYAYRNSYDMAATSRDAAVALLSEIVAQADHFEPVSGLSTINVNPIIESELEARFIEAIRRCALNGLDVQIQQKMVAGKPGYFLRAGEHYYEIEPQLNIGSSQGVHFASCPDFVIRSSRVRDAFKPIAVFMDGYQFHQLKVTEDSAKRLALVQSGHYWQWSLTWADVNAYFAGPATQLRNPFLEGLHEAMQPLQNKLLTRLELDSIRKIPVRNALEQLLLFLIDPQPRKWSGLALVRCLGWFDQASMCTPVTQAAFQSAFSDCSVTALQQQLQNSTGDIAFGGLCWEQQDEMLRVLCALPLSAIAEQRPQCLIANIVLDTSAVKESTFKSAWHGFLRVYNLLQFLPATGFSTVAGHQTGLYEGIPWSFMKGTDQPLSGHAAVASAVDGQALLDEVAEPLRAALQDWLQSQGPVPDIAYELMSAQGEIIAEAELAWPDEQLAGLLAEQACYEKQFRHQGWRTLMLDDAGDWLDVARRILQKENV